MSYISVIVPVYNGGSYIEDCCRQIIEQTLKNIEVIFVDDGSTDDTWKKLLACKSKYDCIKIYHQSNKGTAAARNCGIQHAEGEYIGFVDADDRIDSDMFEVLYKNMISYNADIVCMENFGNPEEVDILSGKESLQAFFEDKIGMSACNKLFRRTVLSCNSFPEGRRIYEDFYAVYKALFQASRAVVLHFDKYHYIHREGSSSRTPVFSEKYFDAITLTNQACEEAMQLYPDLQDLIDGRKARTYLRISKIYYKRKAPAEYRNQIHTLRTYLQNLDSKKITVYFKKTDRIRYYLYLYCKPLFLLLIHSIDRK